MLAGQADPFGYRTAGRCLLKGKRTPRPGTAGVAPRCARPTRAHREKLDTRPSPCGMHIYDADGHVSVAVVHSCTTCYCTTGVTDTPFRVYFLKLLSLDMIR